MSAAPVLRVFVSSTWIDLQPERRAVEEALARLRETKFIGMEYFGSRTETTRDVSLLEVNPTDLYVGIIGGRYGSGITEDEYRRALELKLACFIYFKVEETIGPDGHDTEPEKAGRLARLKEDMHRHCATTFRSPDDLAAKLTADLHRWLMDSYLRGIGGLSLDYTPRIQNLLTEYLGSPKCPVPFGGRDEDMAHLDAWLDSPTAPPYLLLAAPAGRGKTSLLVRWTQQLQARRDLAIAFFPVSVRFRTNLAGVVFPALAARLAYLHGEKAPGGTETSVEVGRDLLSQYLCRPLPDGRRLLLVVDGVDEAADWEPGADLFPLAPEEGLRVVLSARYRGGDGDATSWLRSLGWDRPGLASAPEVRPLTVKGVADVLRRMAFPLDRLGQRVEVVEELYRLSEGDPLLVRLYVDDLWARGEGVARLQPEDLRAICPGLQGYFERWWEDQRRLWGGETPLKERAVRVLLTLLACALGPLSVDEVLRVAPPETGLDTLLLEEAMRPLARIVIGDGRQQGYAFSHPRLGAYFYERFRAECQAMEAHFLNWGKETLAALNDQEVQATAAPYLVQYYGAHLERTRCAPEELLALVSDGWRRAWLALERSYAGFLNDVGRAWRTARATNERQVQTGGIAIWLGAEARCALCQASVQSLAQNLPLSLLMALVRERQWTAAQALAYARQIPEGGRRAEALAVVAPHLAEGQRGDVLREALDAARASGDGYDRATALAAVAPHLGEGQRGDVLRQALDAACTLGTDCYSYRPWALAAVAPHLPSGLLPEALDAARAIEDMDRRVLALVAVALHLAEGQRGDVLREALDAACAVGDKYHRAEALATVAPHLAEGQRGDALREALDAARAVGYKYHRAKALAVVAPHLAEGQRGDVLREALDAARASGNDDKRALALAHVAPHLPSGLLPQALDAARAIRDKDDRARALAAVAPHLAEEQRSAVLREALEATRALGTEYYHRGWALAAVAPHLPAELLSQALDISRTIGDEQHRAQALAAFAPDLPDELLPQALDAARAIWRKDERRRTLAAVALQIAEGQCGNVLRQALTAARAIGNGDDPGEALATLAAHLPAELLPQALDAARAIGNVVYRAEALAAVAPHLSAELLPQALDAARAIEDEDLPARALATIAPHRPTELLPQALDAARAIGDKYNQAEALAAVALHLPEGQRGAVLGQALDAARSIWYEDDRARALATLALRLPEGQRGDVLREALDIARAIGNEDCRATALARVAPHLSAELLMQALSAACAISDKDDRARALAAVAPHLENFPRLTLYCLWSKLLPRLAARTRRDLLSDLTTLTPCIIALGGPTTIADVFRAIEDVGQWWP